MMCDGFGGWCYISKLGTGRMQEVYKILVIGAGASGLAAAKYSLQHSMHSLLVLEKEADVGGLWHPESGSTWSNMRTNVSRYNCTYTDHGWPEDAAVFPLASQLCDYMRDYARHFGVLKHIKFNCEVEEVRRLEDGSYRVTWLSYQPESPGRAKHKGRPRVIEGRASAVAEHVIVGSGMFTHPNTDYKIPGQAQFAGRVVHSCEYKTPEEFEGKRVLIVGGSISGVEISADVSRKADKVYHQFNKPFFVLKHFQESPVSTRRTGYQPVLKLMPADLFSKTRASMLVEFPAAYEDKVRMINQRMAARCRKQQDMQVIGFEADKDFGKVMYVTISSHYVEAVEEKKVEPIKAGLERFTGTGVRFSDGTEVAGLDAVVMCTGYKNPLHFLGGEILQAIEHSEGDNRQTGILYNYILKPQLPGLYFLGQYKGNVVPAVEVQAKYVIRLICKQFELPSLHQMQLEIDAEQRNIHGLKDQPQSVNHNHVLYADKLSREMGTNNDLAQLKSDNRQLFEKYVKLPSIHNERAFCLDDIETTIQQIEDILDGLSDVEC